MPCRPHCRHPPDGSVLADVPSHSVRSGFHHLSSPLITSRKRSPSRRWRSAGHHGNFSDKHRLLDPGTRSGNWQGPNNCLHRRSRPLPQSHSTCWVTHHHPDPIARVTSHSISIANRLLTPALPPYHCWSGRSGPIPAGFVSVGQAIFAQAGQAAQARLSSMNTRLSRSLDWLKMARAPPWKIQLDGRSQFLLRLVSTAPATRPLLHSNPHPAITSDEAGLAKTRQANTARPAASFASSSNFTGPSFRSNCGVHRHSPIDLPLTGLLVEPGPSDGGCMQGME